MATADKSLLKIAVDNANAVTEKQLENVIPVVVKEFKEARDEANAVYNDANATQKEVNNAFSRLSAVLEKLEFYKSLVIICDGIMTFAKRYSDLAYEMAQKETNEKEIHLLEQKGYERMMNEIMPVQQAEVYRKPTKKVVEEAVKELNPDTNSLGSRG